MQGRTDIPLNETGRQQARELAEQLAAGDEWHAVVTSPLLRASGTAEIIAERLGIEVVLPCHDLIERSFGDAEGLSPTTALTRWPTREYPGMEGHGAVAQRGQRALNAIDARFSGKRVLAVSHGSFMRHLLAHIAGTPVADMPRLENATVSEVSATDDGSWHIRSIAGAPFVPPATRPAAELDLSG